MATHKKVKGPTPSGGAYSEIFFLDKNHNEVEPEKATEFIVNEYDENGQIIFTTGGLMQ